MSGLNSDRESLRAGSTSSSLIQQLKHNEADSWTTLYQLYEPLIVFWCRNSGVAEQDIPDLVQLVFQTVARSIDQFSATRSTGSFRGWLRTITNSRVIDWRRRTGGKVRAVGGSTAQQFLAGQPFEISGGKSTEDESVAEEQQAIQELYVRALKIIRDNFREPTWRAFEMVVLEQKTTSEVADQLGISPTTVRVAKSRVLQRLRLELGELPDVE